MLSSPHWSLAGRFWISAATSEPTALASLVLTFSHAAVSKPAWLRPAPVSVTDALLETCQFGARSVVSPMATGARIAQTHPAASAAAVDARARNRDPGTEFLSWIVRALPAPRLDLFNPRLRLPSFIRSLS